MTKEIGSEACPLSEFATRHSHVFIQTVADLPENQDWAFESRSQQMLDNICDTKIIISKVGNIFTRSPSLEDIRRAKNALTKDFHVHENQMKIYICTKRVMDSIRQQKGKHNTTKNIQIHTDRSEAQLLMETFVSSALGEENVSDIHFFVNEVTNKTNVLFRKDGILIPHTLNDKSFWPSEEITSACSAIINTDASDEGGTKKSFNTREAIDASFSLSVASGIVKIRYAQVPSNVGFKVALRLHRDGLADKESKDIAQMGYLPVQCDLINEVVESAAGIIIVSGPTGSGKTTMLNSVIRHIPASKAIYTFEDPIEMDIPFATQVRVDNDTKNSSLSWVALSKNALRLDPDVVMFGELRDQLVAAEAVNMAMTGHLVFTTLHSNGAITCATRLNDLGIDYARLGDPNLLKAFVYQRLLPTTCAECSIELHAYSAYEKDIKKFTQVNALYATHKDVRIANTEQNNPCKSCAKGINGRTLVAEVVEIDRSARAYISANRLPDWEQNLASNDWISINVHAAIHVLKGHVCPMRINSLLSERITVEHVERAVKYIEQTIKKSEALL